jgi:hypothetical protein
MCCRILYYSILSLYPGKDANPYLILGFDYYSPLRYVAKINNTQAITTIQKLIPDKNGIVIKPARMPRSPRIKEIIHTICFGALSFIITPIVGEVVKAL